MPYIKPELRAKYKPVAAETSKDEPGALNYQITCLLDKFVHTNGLSYGTINAAMGVMECAKAEFYRRVAVPYEDKKLEENGDVFRQRD